MAECNGSSNKDSLPLVDRKAKVKRYVSSGSDDTVCLIIATV